MSNYYQPRLPWAIVSGEEIDLPFLATSGPGESVEISTGIEIKGGER